MVSQTQNNTKLLKITDKGAALWVPLIRIGEGNLEKENGHSSYPSKMHDIMTTFTSRARDQW